MVTWLLKQRYKSSIDHAISIAPFSTWCPLDPLFSFLLFVLWWPVSCSARNVMITWCVYFTTAPSLIPAHWATADTDAAFPLCLNWYKATASWIQTGNCFTCKLLWKISWSCILTMSSLKVSGETHKLCQNLLMSLVVKSIKTSTSCEHFLTSFGLRIQVCWIDSSSSIVVSVNAR